MRAADSKRLVIDASVAHAAGGMDAVSPTSRLCRDFLRAVLRICHRVVLTPAIREEWSRHQSSYTSEWRYSMAARRKTCVLPDAQPSRIRRKAVGTTTSDKDREALLKDFHLVSAALATDYIVISLDSNARRLFCIASTKAGELRNVMWVDPSAPEDALEEWLDNGAEPDEQRCLGYQQ
jgi:hypothetical protein